jgi:probable rRNA maturation factor
MIEIEIADQQSRLAVDRERLVRAAQMILQDHGPATCRVSIAVVDDPTIHTLNRQYLHHDYATDVLSFVLEWTSELLEGEVIVSADTALAQAGPYGWLPADELLLYVVHGTLHLVGFDDQTEAQRQDMRTAEGTYLTQFGLTARWVGHGE